MRGASHIVKLLTFPLAAAVLVACGGYAGTSLELPQSANAGAAQNLVAPQSTGIGKIKHVVIIVQENRSLNNLFYGFPGARTVKYGYTTQGRKIKLRPISLDTSWDLEHNAQLFFSICNGTGSVPGTDCRMNGFNKVEAGCGHSGYPACPIKHPPYAYVPHSETKPYFAMAKQYVLADQMYSSNLDSASFVAHQYLISAQAASSMNYPSGPPPLSWGCAGSSGNFIWMIGPARQLFYGKEVPCFGLTTLGQEADDAGDTWAYYATAIGYANSSIWSAYQANKHVYFGKDWKNDVISPQTNFFGDVSAGRLRQITWISPTCANSDHAACKSATGPEWVASLVNAIGESQYWDSTAIFVTWDDYGGWYDPEPPAYVDYDGLGIRVPMLVISAYAKEGFVSHVHYEFGSILRFTEDVFGLPPMSASDTRATSPAKDCFDFNQPPRKFQQIPSSLGINYFIHQPPDLRPPDDQ
jgi:phospholipase C